MRRMLLLAALCLPLGAEAQRTDAEREDAGFLEGLLEGALSDGTRDVNVIGFRGALSSEATIERIEIADPEGVWVTVEGVVLDWNRSALLRGTLDVDELSAERVVLDRLPVSDGVPSATSGTGFSIPELPVSVDVDRLAIGRLVVGEPVAGVPAELTAAASAVLNDRGLGLNLVAERLDAPARFSVSLDYDREAETLDVDVEASEGEDGIVAGLLDLPGRPSVELDVEGEGTLDDFAADIALDTDGEERLGGRATLTALREGDEAGGRRFALDLSGDVTPLFAPAYREFFGEDLDLEVSGVRTPEGRTVIDALDLSSAALRIEGEAALAPSNLPERFDLRILLGDANGPTRLPIGGRVLVDAADLSATFDASTGDAWTLQGRLDGLDTTELDVDVLTLDGGGTIQTNGSNAVSARIEARAEGLMARDPALQRALGDDVAAVLDADWRSGQPATVRLLDVTGDDYGIEAVGELRTEGGIALDGRAGFYFGDLGRLSALAGQPLEGSINGRLEGEAALDGAFDARITGLGQNLAVGIEAVDALLGGRAEVVLDARRDEEGTLLREASVETEALQASAEGTVAPERANLQVALRLDDLGRVVPALEGPVTLDGGARMADGRWSVSGELDGPADTEAVLLAVLPPDGRATVDFDATVGALGDLVPQLPGEAAISGRAVREEGDWTARLTADAPEGIGARIALDAPQGGPLSASYAAEVPEVGAFTDLVEGPAELSGEVTVTDAGTRATAEIEGPEGLRASLGARVVEGQPTTVGYEASVPDLAPFVPQLPGRAAVTGTAVQRDGGWRTNLRLSAGAGITASGDLALDADGGITAALDGRIAEPEVLREGLPGPIDFDADLRRAPDGAIAGEVETTTPDGDRLALEGSLAADGDVEAAFDGRLADPASYLNGLEGPVTANGVATRDDGTWAADFDAAAGDGSTVTAEVSLPPEGTAAVDVEADVVDLAPFLPDLPGPATIDAAGLRDEDGIWTIDVDASAGEGTALTASGTVAEDLSTADLAVDARTGALGAFVPELPGAASVTGRIAKDGDVYDVDVEGTAPRETVFDVEGRIAPDLSVVDVDVDARTQAIGAFVPELPGTASIAGRVTKDGDVYDVDVEGTAPRGTVFDVEGRIAPDLSVADLRLDAETGALGVFVPQVGEGRASVEGTVVRQGERVAVNLEGTAPRGTVFDVEGTVEPGLEDFDLDVDARGGLIGVFVPQLQGEASVSGTIGRTEGVFDLDVDGTAPGATAFDVEGRVAPDLSVADLDFDVSTGLLGRFVPQLQGGARASGTVRGAGADRLAVDVQAFGPRGLSADVEGTLSPDLEFADLDVDARFGDLGAFVPRLSGGASLDGRIGRDGGRWQIAADVGAAGVTARVEGSASEGFDDLSLSAAGEAPLELANPFIRPRRVRGPARFDLRIDGPPALSSLTGTVSTEGARLALPRLRQAIEGISGTVTLSDGTARINLAGAPASGGTIRVEGPIALQPPFRADLTVVADALSVRDPLLYETTVSGQINVSGPLTGGGGAITGRLALGETEIRIPSTGFGGTGAIPAIRHVDDTAAVELTRRRARIEEPPATVGRDGTRSRNAFALDLLIDAERRIFVRGRGLDAELGGSIRLTGTTREVIPVGQFELIRGRLDLLGRRLTLDEGSIQLEGDFVPIVRLVARTDVDDGTISIIVEGDLTEPDITFESSSGLPEDEVISQLLFGRGLDNLSPLQAARLANAVAQLTGRGGIGFIDDLREGAGLDDLDITTDEDGDVGVRAGRYISENIYTDVTVGGDGEAEVTINIDLTDDLTVKGSVDNEGGTGIGIFFERDY
ncbi:autotransporter translocation and assembly factor TamB [Hasllibacter halocynthiae]|uniref:Autotransporter translocation and assembly factor TamB n=1 Tax=Hasllibacter halocynthiae TaxID=595589 RepID=A0A2T0X1V8_9RHOB|nr:translocation/assembly module TamB domain-containing protein [Hasllibacter halocynthiae]PRY92897.1 autotransporter translocation and assembly factor TamB [Hasllibacter halocynthiae]